MQFSKKGEFIICSGLHFRKLWLYTMHMSCFVSLTSGMEHLTTLTTSPGHRKWCNTKEIRNLKAERPNVRLRRCLWMAHSVSPAVFQSHRRFEETHGPIFLLSQRCGSTVSTKSRTRCCGCEGSYGPFLPKSFPMSSLTYLCGKLQGGRWRKIGD